MGDEGWSNREEGGVSQLINIWKGSSVGNSREVQPELRGKGTPAVAVLMQIIDSSAESVSK
jgi:hypothetical protein